MREKRVKMIFEVVVPLNIIIDEETLIKEFGGDIHKVCKYLYKEEGNWWEKKLKLIKTEII